MSEKLKARIAAYNRAAKYGNELYVQLREVFEPLVGEKILKANGQLLAKTEKLMPDLPNTNELMVYRTSTDYVLGWVVKANEFADGFNVYGAVTLRLGVCDPLFGIFKELYDPPNFKDDYTLEEVQAARQRYKELQEQADDAKNALRPFDGKD